MMSLPASQQRALNQIEKTLADDHPGLGPLFAIFGRLVGHEAMPVTERVTARPWRWQRRMRPAVVTLIGLAVATGVLFMLTLRVSGPPVCPGTVTAVAARVQYVPTERQPACAPQQNKPSKPSQSGFYGR
jgi:Zn-dependent protease